ncbi:MAG: hypothetical protein ACLPXW_04240 [Xanthobacteraceae bacterium]
MKIGDAPNAEFIALGERLKAMMPRVAALGLKFCSLHDEASADLPVGWARDSEHLRTFKERSAKNGRDRAYEAWNAASSELYALARAILKIPTNDRSGDGIRAAAALALNHDCDGAWEMADMLWEMAARAGFRPPADVARRLKRRGVTVAAKPRRARAA